MAGCFDIRTLDFGSSRKLVIADAGSTHTRAILLNRISGCIEASVETSAINPCVHSESHIDAAVAPLASLLAEEADVAFFGAGCLPGTPSLQVSCALSRAGASGRVVVCSDITAAVIALFGGNDGIACILGTGSNTAMCRNGIIDNTVPSLGYVLGDEGSGSALGRRLLRLLYRRELPDRLLELFEEETGETLETVIENVYRRPAPNRYLASFTHFIAGHMDYEELPALVADEFSALFDRQLSRHAGFGSLQLGFCGSVAKVFEQQLREVGRSYQCEITSIDASPISSLAEYFKRL